MKTLAKSTLWGAATAITMIAAYATYVRGFRYHRYDNFIAEAAQRNGMDPALVSAVIWRESRFDPYETGRSGEIGLMQVRPDAVREWASAHAVSGFSPSALFDPATNIAVGTWYLSRAIQRWSGKTDPLPYALAEYNAGRSNALRWSISDDGDPARFRDGITYPSTRRYVADVINRSRRRF